MAAGGYKSSASPIFQSRRPLMPPSGGPLQANGLSSLIGRHRDLPPGCSRVGQDMRRNGMLDRDWDHRQISVSDSAVSDLAVTDLAISVVSRVRPVPRNHWFQL